MASVRSLVRSTTFYFIHPLSECVCVFYEELESLACDQKKERKKERTVNSSCWQSFCGLRNKSVLDVCSLLLLLIFLIVYFPFCDINWSCCPCNNKSHQFQKTTNCTMLEMANDWKTKPSPSLNKIFWAKHWSLQEKLNIAYWSFECFFLHLMRLFNVLLDNS